VTASAGVGVASASLKHRFLSLVYEALILAALLLAGALPAVMLTHAWNHSGARLLLQIWLLTLCGTFYVWQWTKVGQTLPMKTWRLCVTARDGSPLTPARAMLRYILALASTFTLGLGFLWALIDRDRLFLHDRLAGTRIVNASNATPAC